MKLDLYEPISIRGQGSFGIVIEAYDRIHDKRVAIKRTHKIGESLSRECEILNIIKECEHIIKLLNVFYTEDEDGKLIENLVLEFIPRTLCGYIKDFKKNKKHIPLVKIKKFSTELLLGLFYCHNKNIVHRDIKPDNICF